MAGVGLLVGLAVAAGGAPDGVRPCSARVEGGSGGVTVDARRDIRVGPVVFFGLRRPERQRIMGTHGRDPGYKIPIAVRTGKPVFLRVPPEARGNLALNYARRNAAKIEDGQSLVLVKPCPSQTRRFFGSGRVGRWTAFSGGFIVRTPGCYPIEVARAGKAFTRRRVAFGRRC
jgi:hypothetical protein